MKNSFLFLSTLILLLNTIATTRSDATVTADPFGLTASLAAGDSLANTITLANDGARDVAFTVEMEEVGNERFLARGPRRDQPESRYAFFQDGDPWNYNMEQVLSDAGVEYDRYGSGDFGEVDLSEYDCIWVVENEQGDNYWQAWNDNIGWAEEWIDAGGVFYEGGGRNVGRVHPIYPGGLHDCENNDYSEYGDAAVGPDDNFLWEYMGWDEDTEFSGNYFCHQYFPSDNVENIENSNWYQVMATSRTFNDQPAIMVYRYGRGYCVVTTTTDGWSQNHAGDHLWGTAGEGVLWYLDFLATPPWLVIEPDEGIIGAGGDEELSVTFFAGEMVAGVYEMLLTINLDDPNQPAIRMSAVLSVDSEVAEIVAAP